MVYLAQLLVVVTDQLKIVRIRAWNVPRTRTQALRRRRVSRISLSLQESDSVVFLMRWGTVLLKHKKTRPGTTCACLAVTYKQQRCHDSIPFHYLIWALWL